MNRLNKLRLNMTVMNTAVLTGLSVFIAVVLYATITFNRDSEINSSLEIYCAQLMGNLDYLEARNKADGKWDEEAANFSAIQEGLDKNSVTYATWDETLKVISSSENTGISKDELKNLIRRYVADHQEKYWVVNYVTNDLNLRICTYTVVDRTGCLKVVQVIKNMADESGVLTNLLNLMAVVVIVGGVASACCGYFLSGRSLVPIKENMERQDEFLADASHELRTPIAVIQTNLEVMQASGEETVDSQKEWLDNAYNETQRMHRIVEDLMFLARADAGTMRENALPVDMDFLCSEVMERMLTVAMAKGISLRVAEPGIPLLVEGDESQLIQLLVILVDNAIKYSGDGKNVTISAQAKGQMVVVRVSDEGIGIEPEEQSKIFERFYRVDKARSRAVGGTGLGLSIAMWIVTQHHGRITVESAKGQGTTMVVELPAIALNEIKED